MHVNYSSLEEKKWGWTEMNIQKIFSEAWRTWLNHVLLPGVPSPVTITGHVLEEMPCISKPASEIVLVIESDFSLSMAVVLTDFLEISKINFGYSISHTFWKPAHLRALTVSKENYGLAIANAKNLHREGLNFRAFFSA